ncbi:Dehydrodolichyl diphosphate synthase 6 [Morus notabilis]|uniref:Dehydrodolichyl diphosphate synthase 6 n=1 Tax=Morus notabilis TaxID=981085 RepID=W9SCG3_9ROSA|nr:Dehydrodolichyl diphosphate synthase 6 [Morus notabilis]
MAAAFLHSATATGNGCPLPARPKAAPYSQSRQRQRLPPAKVLIWDPTDIATRTFSGLIEEDAEVREKQRKLLSIKLVDVEKHMYMGVAPDPDILVRSSGETRLSNFLLCQSEAKEAHVHAEITHSFIYIVLNTQTVR